MQAATVGQSKTLLNNWATPPLSSMMLIQPILFQAFHPTLTKILLSSLKREIVSLLKGRIDIKKEEFYSIKKEMNALSPLSVLERGYALVRDENGKIIRDKKEVKNGDTLYIRVEKGEIKSIVEDNI